MVCINISYYELFTLTDAPLLHPVSVPYVSIHIDIVSINIDISLVPQHLHSLVLPDWVCLFADFQTSAYGILRKTVRAA